MKAIQVCALCVFTIFIGVSSFAQEAAKAPSNPKFDADLAKKTGADEHGMRTYVLVILKTGPNDTTVKGKERDEIFKGHMANIGRLAGEGKLILPGRSIKTNGRIAGFYL
jgi:hypothetical protein